MISPPGLVNQVTSSALESAGDTKLALAWTVNGVVAAAPEPLQTVKTMLPVSEPETVAPELTLCFTQRLPQQR